jgi:acyl-coenzyme A thioesterase PaaI-like protein
MAQAFELIPGRYGYTLERTGEREVAGRVALRPSLQAADGSMRTAAVLMAVDMSCGMAGGLGVLPNWTVTADADIHFVGPCLVGPLRVDAVGVRPGRTMSVVDFRCVDEGSGDQLVAVGTANHGVLASDFEHRIASQPTGARWEFARPDHPDDQSLEDYFEMTSSDGVTRLPLDLRTTNPWGIFHGGLHGLLVDAVATAAGVAVPRDVSLRYLNPVRTGPATAVVASVIERAGDRVVRVEVRNGIDGRLAVIGHVVGR